jgi:hypothetical protein
MHPVIVVDSNTFEVQVRHGLKTPVFPTEKTLEIQALADQIRIQLAEFLEQKHTPLITKLLKLVEEYNVSADPELAAKRLAEQAQIEKISEADKVKHSAVPQGKKDRSVKSRKRRG